MTTELEQKLREARKHVGVAIELVKDGLFLDEFVNDKRASVRATIVKCHPHLRSMLLTDDVTAEVWKAFFSVLWHDVTPDVALLTRFLAIPQPATVTVVGPEDLEILQLKLNAMTEELPTLALTMTCGQLHKAKYKAWARGLTANDIDMLYEVIWHLDPDNPDAEPNVSRHIDPYAASPEVSALIDPMIDKYQLSYGKCMDFLSRFRRLHEDGYNIEEAVTLAQD